MAIDCVKFHASNQRSSKLFSYYFNYTYYIINYKPNLLQNRIHQINLLSFVFSLEILMDYKLKKSKHLAFFSRIQYFYFLKIFLNDSNILILKIKKYYLDIFLFSIKNTRTHNLWCIYILNSSKHRFSNITRRGVAEKPMRIKQNNWRE
jgi:hypothetical protein